MHSGIQSALTALRQEGPQSHSLRTVVDDTPVPEAIVYLIGLAEPCALVGCQVL